MIYVFAALGAFVALVIIAVIAAMLVFVVRSAYQHGRDTAGRLVVVRRPLSDCTCIPASVPSGWEFRIPDGNCLVHGGPR